MALKLSKAQQDVLALAIRAVITATYPDFTKRQERSLRIVYDKLQNERASNGTTHGRQYRLTAREAQDMLIAAAQEQEVWRNTINP